MGKNTKRAEDFIDDIPDSTLTGFPTSGGTIYKDADFRLDMQGMTTGDPKKHNLQVQVTKVTTLKKAAPKTVASLLVLQDDPPSAETIKKELKISVNI
ncbi:uncharacterized protein EAE97_000655 [Botrytis byssoidea]|uniref:Uncharacterized protein n=1 Tax=Botrytis byssoidea TaxID=139641 RepID=A0A9P5IVS8_9HELO|nr:uncharacterized protein EAE97_000655 [Botrytis byssoidea]KAF7955396.1 hypothetical protein EAE97_000655 [Botrytis byssoidea]